MNTSRQRVYQKLKFIDEGTTVSAIIKQVISQAVNEGHILCVLNNGHGWDLVKFIRDFMETKVGGHWNVFTNFEDGATASEPGKQAHFVFNNQRFVVYQSITFESARNVQRDNERLKARNEHLEDLIVSLKERLAFEKETVSSMKMTLSVPTGPKKVDVKATVKEYLKGKIKFL